MQTVQTQTERKRTSHPFAERKQVVELYESGYGSKRIARLLKLDDSTVRLWLRRYRATGLESLQPYWRPPLPEKPKSVRDVRRVTNERLFSSAFETYASTLEPVASITRRYGLDYNTFVYHVKRYHPELVERRNKLATVFQTEGSLAIPGEAKESL